MTPSKDIVGAVIVTYHPDELFINRLCKIANLVSYLVVVDNASNEKEQDQLKLYSKELDFDLVINKTNKGIAAGLNQGLQYIKNKKKAWALLFDQDTDPVDNFIGVMGDIYMGYKYPDLIGIIGANYTEPLIGDSYNNIDDKISWVERKIVITSGSMVPLWVYEMIGGHREDFFIDYVDHEYCLRIRKNGLKVLMSTQSLIIHSIGNVSLHKGFGVTVRTKNHTPLRRYYMFRNFVFLSLQYGIQEFTWFLRCMYTHINTIAAVILLENEKLSKLHFIMVGVWHGMIGRLGKLE